MAILLILACALLDRARGGGFIAFGDSLPARFLRGERPFPPTPHILYGWTVAALCGYPWDGWLTAAIVLGWLLGERPGWGAPMGQVRGVVDPDREPEFYQRWFGGYLWRHPWAALVVRGVIWGVPVLAITALLGEPVWEPVVAMGVAMPAAELVAMWAPDPPRPASWRGAWNECYRGALCGALLGVMA